MASLCWVVHMYVNEPPEVPWVYIDHTLRMDAVGLATYITPHRFYMVDRFSVYRRPYTQLPRRGHDK